MKNKIIIGLVIWSAASAIFSQTKDYDASPDVSTVTTARILGEIPDGTPPAPEPPKPEYHIAARDILDTTTHQQGGRTITIRQIKPIDLPPLPVPVVAAPVEVDAEYAQRLAEYREAHPKSDLLFLSAMVYRSKDSPPRTLVRYWPGGKDGDITFWSSADFALIAGGINSFVDSAGDNHYLMMAWSKVDIERMAELYAAKGREYDVPDMPEFVEGKASYQVTGEQPDAESLAPIQALHDLYNSEYERLKTAYEGRERSRNEREAYLKANPPQPKDITLNYWRTETPATNEKGESKLNAFFKVPGTTCSSLPKERSAHSSSHH
jgi:hypothetical protein